MKKITVRTTLVVLTGFFLAFLLATFSGVALAADPVKFDPNVAIPGEDFDDLKDLDFSSDSTTRPIALYIRAIFKYGIGIVGVLASVVLMWGGVIWLTAGGNSSRISEAKSWIGASLTGLVLALSSFLLLSTINPDLVDLKTTDIKKINNEAQDIVTEKSCCSFYSGVRLNPDNPQLSCEKSCISLTTEDLCKSYVENLRKMTPGDYCLAKRYAFRELYICDDDGICKMSVNEEPVIVDPNDQSKGCCTYRLDTTVNCKNNTTFEYCDKLPYSAWNAALDCEQNSDCDRIVNPTAE